MITRMTHSIGHGSALVFTPQTSVQIDRWIVEHTVKEKSRIKKAGAEELNPHASDLVPYLILFPTSEYLLPTG